MVVVFVAFGIVGLHEMCLNRVGDVWGVASQVIGTPACWFLR
jgi:TM2 domain-containing membrane protein YozV